jgi:hypothetical protein
MCGHDSGWGVCVQTHSQSERRCLISPPFTPRHKSKKIRNSKRNEKESAAALVRTVKCPKKDVTVTASAATVGYQELVVKTCPSSNLHYYSLP